VDYGYNAGIAVGMINREGRAFLGYGQRDLNQGGRLDERTLFEIGSVTKVLTSILLADAVARGEVGLHDPVQGLLPATVTMPRGAGEITLEHLASQRSGLPDNPDNLCLEERAQPFECYTEELLYEYLNRFELPREPGLTWEYSNTGFGLLGHALSRRAGMPYEALLRERVLEPLGMTATGIQPRPEQVGNQANGYSGVLARPPFRISGLEGAGALRSTVEDLLTFLAFNLGFRETPLSGALNDTHRRRAATAYPGISTGLGWWLWGLPGGQVAQHGGDTPGFTAFIGFHKAKGLGVVVLSNARTGTYSAVSDVGLSLLDPQFPLLTINRPANLDLSTLGGFAGIYREPGGDTFEFGIVHDHLVAYHPGSKFEMTMHPESARRFAAHDLEVGPNVSALFQMDSGNRVAAMDWTQGGKTTRYSRHAEAARTIVSVVAGRRLISVTGGGGGKYAIEASSDLRSWRSIGSVATPAERVEEVAGDGGEVARFYRALRQ
jgi:CubicO group peptidase (beta-lactamase class C family)